MLTSNKGEANDAHVIRESISWSGLGLLKIFTYAKKVQATDILVEYTPYMYDKRGINITFPLYLLFLKVFTSLRVTTFFHEINHPFEWSLKTLILFLFHKIQAIIICLASCKVFSSCIRFQRQLQRLSFKRVHHLPIGSNILVSKPGEDLITKYKIESRSYAIVFGGFHISKCLDWVYEACFKNNISLIHLGATPNDVPEELKKFITDKFIYTSYLSNEEVSSFLQLGFPLLCPFIDGASTRRGTLIAGINHGTRVLSTKTKDTEAIFNSFVNVTLVDTDKEGFLSFIKKNKSFFEREDSMPLQDSYFSWKKIIDEFLSY